MDTKKVSAIIPAYNEEKTIKEVIKQIKKSSLVDEIVVIDDGSTDETYSQIKLFSNITILQNSSNRGKAYSMNKAVNNSTGDIIYFSDADLGQLDSSIIDSIIQPVKDGEFDMFIGLRNNLAQKTLHLFAINSGERALNKTLWYKVPSFYKHKFRIEIGLNYYAKYYGNGFGYKKFKYYQTLKEKKYGILKGIKSRTRLFIDMSVAYFHAYIIDYTKNQLMRK